MDKTYFFDLDGTLLGMDQDKFLQVYFSSIKDYITSLGHDYKVFFYYLDLGTKAMLNNKGKNTNEYEFINATKSYKGIIDIFNDYYEKKFSLTKETTYKNEYSKLIIDSLKSQGFDLVLATNPLFPRFVTEYRIKWAGLSPSDFKYITSYENSSFTKPKKEYYDEILTKLNIKREDVIYLGNDVDDDYGIIGVNYFSKSYLITDCLINKNNKNLDIEKITLKEFYQKIKA